MKTYYVEIYNPPFPNMGNKCRAHASYPGDSLSPDLLMLFEVEGKNAADAICRVMMGEARTLISPDGKKLVLSCTKG